MADNRFEQLRYKDKLSLDPEISMNQLAKKMDTTAATISKLEHDENYDARISIIKKYKEVFPDITYDYLLGATNTKHKQYNRIEETLPFGNEFYENLETFFHKHIESRDRSGEWSEYATMDNIGLFMEAFMSEPDKLISMFEILMDTLLFLRRADTDKLPSSIDKDHLDYYVSGIKQKMASSSLDLIMTTAYPKLYRLLDKIINEEDEAATEAMKNDPNMQPF